MTYIDYMNQLWRSASREFMPASEIALYAYIVNECNKRRWIMPVPCPTFRICSELLVSKPTIVTSRTDLCRRGLISCEEGKSRHVPPKYSLLELTDNLTQDFTDALTEGLPLIKDKDKKNSFIECSTNFSNIKSSIRNGKDKRLLRRGVEEIPLSADEYESSF